MVCKISRIRTSKKALCKCFLGQYRVCGIRERTVLFMRAGSAWTQPPKIKHKINDYSEDAELLEIILPADFETEELAG